jgi:hypothetical protein
MNLPHETPPVHGDGAAEHVHTQSSNGDGRAAATGQATTARYKARPSPSKHPFNPDDLRRFLGFLMDPETGALEFRVFNAEFDRHGWIVHSEYSRTLAGWYSDPATLVADAGRLRGVSGYVTFNPIDPRLFARSLNKLSKCEKGHGTSDADIVAIRWMFTDVDAVRPDGISSSAEELAAAIRRRDDILTDHPDLAARSLWGCSGNGGFILTRLPDYPNDAEHRLLVGRGLAALDARYSTASVKVDVKTKNPSRVMPLCGTRKCKGSDTEERPWRLATLDGVGEGLR